MQWVNLAEARMQLANLADARMQLANLADAQMQGAFLMGTEFQGANLNHAQLQGANLNYAEFHEATLNHTQLQGAFCEGSFFPNSFNSFEKRISSRIGKDSDLSCVTFAGGLSQDRVDRIVAVFSAHEAESFRCVLKINVGADASHDPPGYAVTGAYTAEEAEQWIDEYNEATKDIEA